MGGTSAPRELVLASAGSGKTYRISSRLISLLAYGIEPEEILAATFTRKAAGEILDRVLDRLARAALDPAAARQLAGDAALEGQQPLPEEPGFWAELLAQIVQQIHRLNIGTLDSFFMRSALSFGVELGLPAEWRIGTRAAEERIRSDALLELFEALDRTRLSELIRSVSRGEASRSVHLRLFELMEQLVRIEEEVDPTGPDPWATLLAGAVGIELEPEEARRRQTELAAELSALPLPRTKSGEHKKWREGVDKLASLVAAGSWPEVLAHTLCRNAQTEDPCYHQRPIEDPVLEQLEKIFALARTVLRPVYAAQVMALGEICRVFLTGYRRIQRAQGTYQFSDITRLIGGGDPLAERPDLYYRLDARIRHMLLDEFQDTSNPQWSALAPLLDEILSDPARAAIVVADPKQSIYGWRGADPGVVHHLGAHYGLSGEQLATSWRSSQVVLDFVNQIFTPIAENPAFGGKEEHEAIFLSTAAGWVRDFTPHRAEKTLPGHVRVEVGPEEPGTSQLRPQLLRYAAERIASLHQAAPGCSIGVLTRTNKAGARLFLELQQLGIPVSMEGKSPLSDSAACETVLALLHFADHPSDTIARYQVTSSPLGRVLGWTDPRDEVRSDAIARQIRSSLLGRGYGRTLASLARRLAPYCDRRDARRLGQLVEAGYRYDPSSTLRPGDFIRLVESERVEDRASAPVRVMTVHQSKGLEFDIVVLAQLNAAVLSNQAPLVLPCRPDPQQGITRVTPVASKEIRELLPELQESYAQWVKSSLQDELSGLYVALTRARHAVHLIIAPEVGKGRSLTPARIVRAALPLNAGAGEEEGAILYEAGDAAWISAIPHAAAVGETQAPIAPALPHLVATARTRFLRMRKPSDLQVKSRVEVRDLLRLPDRKALARGTIVHAWFECIGWIEEPIPGDDELLEIGRALAGSLDEARLRAILAEFRQWTAGPALHSVLSRSRYPEQADLEREMPFLHRHQDTLMEGVIDRLVLSSRGGRVVAAEIIDFKSDRTGSDPERVAQLAAHYAPQIDAYRAAVAELYDLPRSACTGTLVFLEAERVVPLTPPALPVA